MAGYAALNSTKVSGMNSISSMVPGTIIYWECSDFFGLDYDPSILLHDSDGCEYALEGKKLLPGIVLTEFIPAAQRRGIGICDVLCADGVIRRIDSCSMWVVPEKS